MTMDLTRRFKPATIISAQMTTQAISPHRLESRATNAHRARSSRNASPATMSAAPVCATRRRLQPANNNRLSLRCSSTSCRDSGIPRRGSIEAEFEAKFQARLLLNFLPDIPLAGESPNVGFTRFGDIHRGRGLARVCSLIKSPLQDYFKWDSTLWAAPFLALGLFCGRASAHRTGLCVVHSEVAEPLGRLVAPCLALSWWLRSEVEAQVAVLFQ